MPEMGQMLTMISFTMWGRLDVHLFGRGYCWYNVSYHDLGATTNTIPAYANSPESPMVPSNPLLLFSSISYWIQPYNKCADRCPADIGALASFLPLLCRQWHSKNSSCWFGKVGPNFFLLKQANKQLGLNLPCLSVYLKKILMVQWGLQADSGWDL